MIPVDYSEARRKAANHSFHIVISFAKSTTFLITCLYIYGVSRLVTYVQGLKCSEKTCLSPIAVSNYRGIRCWGKYPADQPLPTLICSSTRQSGSSKEGFCDEFHSGHCIDLGEGLRFNSLQPFKHLVTFELARNWDLGFVLLLVW